jgi:hypothetical protein
VVKKESSRVRSSFGGVSAFTKPVSMSTRASRVDGWSVFSRLIARCVAARAVGEGGRGAGFIACATIKGMVGILTDDTTGSAHTSASISKNNGETHWNNPVQWSPS